MGTLVSEVPTKDEALAAPKPKLAKSAKHTVSATSATGGLVATIVWFVNWRWKVVIPGEVAAFMGVWLLPFVSWAIPDAWEA